MPAAALVTIPNVEVARVGTWDASTGRWTCTAEDLADAVRAASDPTFRTPIIKLGHSDPRFNGAEADPVTGQAGDGQPAVGRIDNLRLSEDGQVLIGDLVGVPAWLAAIIPSAYPSRSIEADLGVKTDAGESYRMVLTGLALLGVAPPAIENLNDLRQLYGMPEELDAYLAASKIAASVPQGALMPAQAATPPTPTPPPPPTGPDREPTDPPASLPPRPVPAEDRMDRDGRVALSATLDQLLEAVKAYAASKGLSDYVWTREVLTDKVILDDDYGRLWEVDWTESGGNFTFTGPFAVQIRYERIADTVAGRAAHQVHYPLRYVRGQGNAAVHAASANDERTAVADLTETARAVREALGLPEDASEEQVQAAMLEKLQSPPADPTPPPPAGTPATPETSDQPAEPEPVLASADREELRRVSAELAAIREQNRVDARENLIRAARRDGKIRPADEEKWRARYDRDAEYTAELLADLHAGSAVPVAAKGRSGSTPAEEADVDDLWSKVAPQFGIRHPELEG